MPEPHKRNPNIKCIICGKDIYRRPAQIKNNEGRVFCSTSCHGISCRKEKPCLVCGKLILSSLNKKTCSRTCANIHRAGINYNIGRPHDKASTQRAIKLRLIEKRGKVCEKCGYDKLPVLQVHHIDENRNNNDLQNLKLLCPNCHCEKHYLDDSWLKEKFI